VNRFTVATRCPAPVWPHQRRMVRAAWMEKTMSNTTTRNLESREVRELSHAELALVSAGVDFCKTDPLACIPVPVPPPPPPTPFRTMN
jgi:hypothetical protein